MSPTRREFLQAAGVVATGAAHLRAPRSGGHALWCDRGHSAGGEATLRDCRHGRARHRHVGPPDGRALRRAARVRRPLRHQREARGAGAHGHRRHVPDLHRLRPDVRHGQARPADGHDRGRVSRRLHHTRAGPRHRRHHREAHGDRRAAVPAGAGGRAPQQPQDRRRLQLPVRAQAREDQGGAAVGRHRHHHGRRLPLVSRHAARRRLLPPLAPAEGEGRLALGAQGHAPLRSRSTGGSTPTRSRSPPSASFALRPQGAVPLDQLPALPAQGHLPVLLGHHQRARA